MYIYSYMFTYIYICLYIYVFTYTHIYVYTHIYICIIYIYICIHSSNSNRPFWGSYVYICTHIYIHIFLYIYIYIYTCIHICIYIDIFMYTYVYVYTHIYIYISYSYKHIHSNNSIFLFRGCESAWQSLYLRVCVCAYAATLIQCTCVYFNVLSTTERRTWHACVRCTSSGNPSTTPKKRAKFHHAFLELLEFCRLSTRISILPRWFHLIAFRWYVFFLILNARFFLCDLDTLFLWAIEHVSTEETLPTWTFSRMLKLSGKLNFICHVAITAKIKLTCNEEL